MGEFLDQLWVQIASGFIVAAILAFVGWTWRRWRPSQPSIELQPLKPLLEHDDNAPGSQVWWNVAVSNPNDSPVTRCYGKIVEYRILRLENTLQGRPVVPRRGTLLPWRAAPEGDRRLEADIGGESTDYLDLAHCEHATQGSRGRSRTPPPCPCAEKPPRAMDCAAPVPEAADFSRRSCSPRS